MKSYSSHYTIEVFTMDDKLNFLYELLNLSRPIYHWRYSFDGTLLESNAGSDERIMDMLFSANGVRKYMQEYARESTMPLLLSSSLGNFWAAIFEPQQQVCHILGPLFTEIIAPEQLQKRASQYDIPVSWKRTFVQLIRRFPVISWNILTQYVIMLHYTVTGEQIEVSDFAYQTVQDSVRKKTPKNTNQEHKKNLPWIAEQALLDNIRTGNLNYHSALSNAATISSGVGIQTGDSLQQAKYSGVVFTSSCTRAAIEGGLSPQVAYTLQNEYSQNIVGTSIISDIANINHQMYEDFIQRVHNLHASPKLSSSIQNCCDYLELHVSEKTDIQKIAEQLGYAPYYLSRRFQKETGVSINTYNKNLKIRQAKHLLAFSTMTIQEISDQLSFSSRSHFSDTFQHTTGISPGKYRKENSKISIY